MADTLIAYAHLPRIDRGDVRLLWHCDFRSCASQGKR
jgi:hypothetical protein